MEVVRQMLFRNSRVSHTADNVTLLHYLTYLYHFVTGKIFVDACKLVSMLNFYCVAVFIIKVILCDNAIC